MIPEWIGIVCTLIAILIAVITARPVARFVALFFIVIATNHLWLDHLGTENYESAFYVYAFFDTVTAYFFMLWAKNCSGIARKLLLTTALYTSFAIMYTFGRAYYGYEPGFAYDVYGYVMATIAVLLLGISAGEGLAWSNFVSSNIRGRLSRFRAFDSRMDSRCEGSH